ncbi:hypothetical protein KCU85_g357, partial [Aureobasidium melanogenum]
MSSAPPSISSSSSATSSSSGSFHQRAGPRPLTHGDSNTHIRGTEDFAHQDFTLEGTEDNHAKVNIDVYDAGAVADETFAGLEYVVEGYAEADAMDHFVCIFGVDVVFDCLRAALFKLLIETNVLTFWPSDF